MDGTKPAMESNAEDTQDEGQESKGCFDCCIKCLGRLPYATLVATILCFSGVALFCGSSYVAMTGTLDIVKKNFAKGATDTDNLSVVMKYSQFGIFGIGAFFLLYAIILLAEGFFTTGTIKKELQSDFKTTGCGRCITAFFIFLTYILALVFLAILTFMAIPVFIFFNMKYLCSATTNSVCLDLRNYGVIPWAATPGQVCDQDLKNICLSNEFHLSYHLYFVAFAGAAATVIALCHYLMILGANWAYLKSAASTHEYQDIKTKDDQDVEADARSKEGQNSSSYS